MPAYTLDPDQLAAEIRTILVTDEPIAEPGNGAATPEDVALITECYDTLLEGSPQTVQRLTALTTRYPDDPALKNHLSAAYSAAGDKRQARHLNQQLRQEHPDYLFGRINEATYCLLDGDTDELARIPELLGESLRLQDREPDRDLFHISEVKCFYTVVAHFHLRSGRPELAAAIHAVLEEMVEDRDVALLQLKRDILTDSIARLKAQTAVEEARAIRVSVPPPPDTAAQSEPPNFHHPEIEDLYRYELDIPPSRLAAILALSRESVIADLEAVLRDSLDRGPLFLQEHIDFEDEEIYFAVHAIFLLGELRAADSLPLVLEVLSQHPDALDFWFNDILHEDLWEPLYHLVDGQHDVARRWMTSPGIPGASRGVLAGAFVQIALHQPDRREEVIAWFRGILEFLLDSPPKDNILDTRLVTHLVSYLMDLRASELLPVVTALVERGYVAAYQVGDLDAIREELAGPPDMEYRQPLLRVANRYRSILGPPPKRPSHEHESLVGSLGFFPRLSPASLSAPSPKPKVGRNAPCPCGSGKKYKKCCL